MDIDALLRLLQYGGVSGSHAQAYFLITRTGPNGTMEEAKCISCDSKNCRLLFQTVDLKVSRKWFDIVKCDGCGLVFTAPKPPESQIGKFYPNKYYAWRRYHPKKNSKDKERKKADKSRVLDIGCGNGKWMFEQRAEGNEVYGVEIDYDAAKTAADSGLNIFFGKLEEAKFARDFFDIIRINHVLEHLYNPIKCLREVRRILKRDGRCVIGVPNVESMESILLKASWRQLDVPRHLFHFSPSSLEKLVDKAGLNVRRKRFSYFPNRLADLESYVKCQYSILKLMCINLKRERTLKQNPLIFLVAFYGFVGYFSKTWCLRALRKIKPENKSAICYICAKE